MNWWSSIGVLPSKTGDMNSNSTSSPTIIRAGLADIPQIRAMAGVVFPATYATIITPEQTDYMMHMMYDDEVIRREMTELGIAWFIVRQSDGTPCGFVSIGRDTSHVADTASVIRRQEEGKAKSSVCQEAGSVLPLFHLHKIYVLPAFQGQGLGHLLFQTATAYACSQSVGGLCRIELNVNRHNKALDFYRREGMHIARSGDFPIGNGFFMNDYIMAIEV